jgi:predicted DNA-binding transcriptional regulator YafY
MRLFESDKGTFMPKVSADDQLQRVQDLWERLPLLGSGNGIGAEILKDWAEKQNPVVSYRTVQRDLKDLKEQGRVDSQVNGNSHLWFRLPSGSPRSALMTRDEALIHALVAKKMQHLLPKSIYDNLKTTFKDAETKLQRTDLKAERDWFTKIAAAPTLLQPAEFDSAQFQTIVSALLNEHLLSAIYKQRDQKTVRENIQLMPLGIAEINDIYYLIARYENSDKVYQFRLDRFIEATELDMKFTYPKDFKLKDYLDDGAFNYSQKGEIKLRLKMRSQTAQHLNEQALADNQEIVELVNEAGWSEVRATVQDGDRLHWWLQSLGANVIVLEPQVLRQQMLTLWDKLQDLYQE